jgi:hypothetical protein
MPYTNKLKRVIHLKFYPYFRIPFLRNYSKISNKLSGHILAPVRGPKERAFNLWSAGNTAIHILYSCNNITLKMATIEAETYWCKHCE